MNSITKEDLLDCINRMDMALRPNIIFVHPLTKDKLYKAIPDIEDIVVINETEFIEAGKIIMMSRSELERWICPDVQPICRVTDTGDKHGDID